MLERLLELPTNNVNSTLNQATQLVADVLAAEKVEAFLHDAATDALVALDNSETPIQPINLADLVCEVVPAFSGPETPIQVHIPQDAVLLADPDRLRQVLENLLANAVKYAPKCTFITVQVSGERRTDGPWMLLTVSNEGPGMASEECAQLLRPFVAGATSTGLGLGPYLANRIAEAHYGTLTVDSPAGRECESLSLYLWKMKT